MVFSVAVPLEDDAQDTVFTVSLICVRLGDDAFFDCTGLTSIVIPDSVTSIGYSAFENCTGLTSIVIPNSVKSIYFEAFEGCTGLTSIVIPDSVTSIGDAAFKNCRNLVKVVLPKHTQLSYDTFANCPNLSSLSITRSHQKR